MRKVQATAVFWTLIIAIPFTGMALAASAYISDHLIQIATSLMNLGRLVVSNGRDLLFEAELIGLLTGQLIIITILVVVYLPSRTIFENNTPR